MRRKFRLNKSSDIQRVRRLGRSYAHPLVVLVADRNETGALHVAVSAGKSVGNAVQRNRAKRLLREALRPLLPHISPGWDLVLLARRPISGQHCQEVSAALVALLKRSHLYIDSHDERLES